MDAVDILDASAHRADGVMVVVMGASLIAGRRTRRIEAAQQVMSGEIMQHGVDRLDGDLRQFLSHRRMDCFCRLVRILSDGVQYGQALLGHA